jgi:hypothetical protein
MTDTTATEAVNQCDGCRAKMAVNANGNHEFNGVVFMGCTKDRYADAPVPEHERADFAHHVYDEEGCPHGVTYDYYDALAARMADLQRALAESAEALDFALYVIKADQSDWSDHGGTTQQHREWRDRISALAAMAKGAP